jgi:DNA-binding PadR family transcriptional regulator
MKVAFLIKQRAVIKLYLFKMMERKAYGLDMRRRMMDALEDYAFTPSHTEVYDTLHEMIRDGLVHKTRRVKGGAEFQEIVEYELTEKGKSEADLYAKQAKVDLDRSIGLLRKVVADNYNKGQE